MILPPDDQQNPCWRGEARPQWSHSVKSDWKLLREMAPPMPAETAPKQPKLVAPKAMRRTKRDVGVGPHGNRTMRMKVTDVVVGGFEGQDTVISAIGKSMTMMRVCRQEPQRLPAHRLTPKHRVTRHACTPCAAPGQTKRSCSRLATQGPGVEHDPGTQGWLGIGGGCPRVSGLAGRDSDVQACSVLPQPLMKLTPGHTANMQFPQSPSQPIE